MSYKYSKSAIHKINKTPSPRVLLNVCTHGSERVGLKVARYFADINPQQGLLVINIANEEALTKRKRFLASDLNRVFPGTKRGNHEERLAYRMAPFVRAFDYVIDIHSTETDMDSTIIVTKFNRSLVPLLNYIAPERVVYMSATKSNALISIAKHGIAFEFGKDKDPQTYETTLRGIERALEYLNMIPIVAKRKLARRPAFFEAYASFPKPAGYIAEKNIRNFELFPKGGIVGHNPATKKEIRAPSSFYPVLFGNNSYKTIFGFVAKKRSS